jgi:hypothetical protein
MSIVEIDAYLRNSQQKVDNTSNSKKSASQALFKRRSKENFIKMSALVGNLDI